MVSRLLSLTAALLGSLLACEPRQECPRKPHVVFVTGDCEYRSEISMPMLAGILEKHHGFRCTVCLAVDNQNQPNPKALTSIAGLEALADADCAVFFLRYRKLPPDQLQRIVEFTQSGKPLVGFRTTTHAFRYPEGPEANLNDSFGREIFGQKWISHHGHDSSTNVCVAVGDHPICRGIAPTFFCRSWLYQVTPLAGDCTPLLIGQATKGEQPGGTLFGRANPVAWTKTHAGAKVFFTTLGHPKDFEEPAVRRLAIQGIFWAMGKENAIPATGLNVEPSVPYQAPPTH